MCVCVRAFRGHYSILIIVLIIINPANNNINFSTAVEKALNSFNSNPVLSVRVCAFEGHYSIHTNIINY